MQDSENSKPENVESSEQLSEQSTQQSSIPEMPLDQMRQSHDMLIGFREGVREGSYQGRHLIKIAQGLMFLDKMIGQCAGQIEVAKQREKEMMKKAKEAIKDAGGKIH